MTQLRLRVLVPAALAGLLAVPLGPGSVAAQDDQGGAPTTEAGAPPTTGSTTTELTSSVPTSGSTPSSTSAPDSGPTTTTPGGDDALPTTSEGDAESTTVLTNENGEPIVDLGAGEEPAEVPPDVDVTVPPPDEEGSYTGQAAREPDRVLVSSVREARAKLSEAEDDHLAAVAVVKSLRLRLKELELEKLELDEKTSANLDELAQAEDRLRARALSAFVRGGTMSVGNAVDPSFALDYEAQQTIADVVFENDDALIADYLETRARLDTDALALFDRTRVVTEALFDSEADVQDRATDIEQAQRELEAFEAGSQIYIAGVVFPILWPYEVPLIDSWGFPRMTGTADEHWHEGIDIFAPSGTPLVATERGLVTRIGTGRLGGLRLWLRGESGTDWYYAHLSGFAEGLTEGQVVEVGEVLGYVGNTGNAVGTPPHLHMQVHPNGGDPVNPYPLLKVVSDKERAAADLAAASGGAASGPNPSDD